MKKWLRSSISWLLAIAMIAGSAGFVRAEDAVNLTDGLVAHYDFETVDGTTVANNVASNAATTAVLSGNASVTSTDHMGRAMQLSGGGLQLTNIVNASQSSFSVSLWYKANSSSGSNVNLVQAGTIRGGTGRTILILTPDSKYQTYVTGDNAKTPTGSAVTRTEWQHVTFSYDRDSSKAYFFVNGLADRDEGLTLSGTALNTADMIIGRHRNDGEGPLNGLVDEVRVYDRPLTAEEAAAIYAYAPAVTPDPDPEPEPDVADVTLTVDVNDPQRVIDSDSIFGINHRYAFNGYGSFDSETMQIKEDFKRLYEQAGFGSLRYPGGTISNLFNWKTSIGPVESRKNQIHGFYDNAGQGGIAPNFGLAELGSFTQSVGSEIVYVYSLGRGNAQDAADLIEYLNAQVGTNPNGGVDWAAVRAENGHPAPYNVRYFEIGNEMQQAWAGSDGTASQGYWTTSVSGGSENAYIDGGVATFTRQYAVCEEDWNNVASRSDGSPNQVRYMRYANVNPKMLDENGNLVDDPSFQAVNDGVSVYVGQTQWQIVESFANSGAADQHVVVDYSTGAIHFGDGVHGAIPASGSQIFVSYSVDRDGFLDVSQAIHDTIDAINEREGVNKEVYIYSSYESQGFINKMAQRGANHLYDGLTIHPYSGTPSGSGDSFYDSAISLAETSGIAKVQNYVNMMPADKVPVISEYGIFRSTDALVRSQTHAIYIAKVLMEYVRLGSPYIQKHCLIDWYSSGADSLGPTQQAVIQAVPGADANTVTGEGTFTFFSTPSAHVFQMLNAGFGDTIVSSQFSTVPTMGNGAKTLSALASTDENSNIYVAIVNASREEDYNIELSLEGIGLEGAAVTAMVLTADSYAAQNSPQNPDAVRVLELTIPTDSGDFSQVIPRHTFVVLKIDPAQDLDTAPVVGSFTAEPDLLYTRGGDVTVSLTGRNLPDGILIRCGETIVATTGNSLRQSAVLTFPANTTEADQVYTLSYSLDGENFLGDLTVTVPVGRVEPSDDSRDIPVAVLTATAGDEQSATSTTEGPARLVLDGNPGTIWHTDWYGTSRDNHWIQFELSEDYTVDGLRYLPRSGSQNGVITQYDIQVSDDGETFRSVASGNWEGNGAWKIASFSPAQVRFVRLVSLNAISDNSYVFASAAEIRLTGVKAEAPHVHEFSDWTVTTEPTCAEKGVETRSCACGLTEIREVAALGHDDETGICVRCGELSTEFFQPYETVTRGKLIYMLWLLSGSPEPADLNNPFIDVNESDYYWKAVLWAVEAGITSGYDPDEFVPHNDCLRAVVATFLWRAYGWPEPEDMENPFTDVNENSFYYNAVLWAVQENLWIADSSMFPMSYTLFHPNEVCTFGQILGGQESQNGDIVPGWEPTCTRPGLANEGRKLLPALGHELTDDGCTRCCKGHPVDDAHEWDEGTVIANTCTEQGYTVYICTACGLEHVDEDSWTEPLGHNYEPTVIEPTCTERGCTVYTCTRCKSNYVDESTWTDALGHEYVDGKCTRCGYLESLPFEDVLDDSFYYNAVHWATMNGVTSGVDPTHFDPNGECMRGHVVTFLWRAYGSPDPMTTVNPFNDVHETDYYYKAVLWAVENGITNGMTPDTFCPFEKCNRAQVVTFLWRAMGAPEPIYTTDIFEDVPETEFYYKPVQWAVEANVTTGITDTTFGPKNICNRAQVVTFLYRAISK